MKHILITCGLIAIMAVLIALPARAATVTWIATGTNDWSNTNNWSTTNVPAAGDDVIINYTNVGVLLTNSTAELASILLTNKCSLIFSNWDTSLSATNVNILTNASMTCAGPFTNNVMSNRVWIICSNLTIAAGGSINVDGKGYAKGTSAGQQGSGPGYGYTGYEAGSGAGYGGAGAPGYYGYPGGTYGSTNAPLYPGSGGGGATYGANGTDGGGAVRIEAAGAVTINGIISADAPSVGHRQGGGSGGAVYITCNTFAGTNGIIRASGAAYSGGGSYWATGGGGRIAVVYQAAAQAPLSKPRVRFSADRGRPGYYGQADIGSIYFTDWTVMDYDWMAHTGVLGLSNFTAWSVSSLLVTNGYIRIPSGNPLTLTVTNDLNIVGPTGIFWIGNGVITCGNISITAVSGTNSFLYLGTASALTNVQTLSCTGNVTLSTNTSLYVYAANTNAAQTNYGALVDVAGDISIATGAWIYAYSHNTNGGSLLVRVRNLTIATGGGINANAAGWRGGIQNWGLGPGRGGYSSQTGGGGGYGGGGGTSGVGAVGGGTYGSSNAPILPGSGGGGLSGNPGAQGGNGGGLVRLEAANTITVNGTVTANGGTGQGGGGSGGGIYLSCQRFAGSSNGLLSAVGGNGLANYTGSGGGGGGRIAVWRRPEWHFYQGSYTVTGGVYGIAGGNGTNGTFFLGNFPTPGTIFTVH